MQSTSLTTVGKLKAHKNWIFIFSLVLILLASFVLPTLEPIYAKVKVPVASGKKIYENNNTIIDASNLSSGYIMIKYTGNNSKIKIRITKTTTYTYDLNTRNQYETFPLTEGNGTYNIKTLAFSRPSTSNVNFTYSSMCNDVPLWYVCII